MMKGRWNFSLILVAPSQISTRPSLVCCNSSEKMAACFGDHLGAVVFVVAALLLASTEKTGAAQHVVGYDRGWDLDSNLLAWGIGRIFRAGDILWFAYSGGDEESIVELQSKEEFESCDLRNPIQMYTNGLDKVRLHEQGTRYFSSSKPEQCKKGLKLHVDVMPTSSDKKATAAAVVLDRAMAPEPSFSNSTHHLGAFGTVWILVVVFTISLGLQF